MKMFPLATPGLRAMRRAVLATVIGGAAFAAHAQSDDSAQTIERGRQVAVASDCIACHTHVNGKPFAGGLPLASPLGTIYSTNITPSEKDGIGKYTQAQFTAAVRDGIRADGAHLYPAMPYTSYARMTDADVAALYAYFMHGVAPVDTPSPKTALPFPFNLRWSMAMWNALYLTARPYTNDDTKSVEWNRGAYLVEGLAHCSACHTPRNFLMAEDTSRGLGGASLGTWYAPNITSAANSGIGNWSEADVVDYLRTGRTAAHAQAAGPMAEAIDHSFSHMSDADLKAMAVYLKGVPAVMDGAKQPANSYGKTLDSEAAFRGVEVPAKRDLMTGAQVYDGYCASCHQANGAGSYGGGLPTLVNNTVLGRPNADNVVMVVLDGIHRQSETPSTDMPAFGKMLSDTQVATLTNYLFEHFGNSAVTTTPARVAALRAGGEGSILLWLARGGMIFGALVVVGAVVWQRRRKQRRSLRRAL